MRCVPQGLPAGTAGGGGGGGGSSGFRFATDWGLGLPQSWSAEAAMHVPDPETLVGRPLAPGSVHALRRDPDALARTLAVRSYYLLVAQLYLLSWQQLVRLGALVTTAASAAAAAATASTPSAAPSSTSTMNQAHGTLSSSSAAAAAAAAHRHPLGAAATGSSGGAKGGTAGGAPVAPVRLAGVFHYSRLVSLDAGSAQDKPKVEASAVDRMAQVRGRSMGQGE